jgi:DNA-binding beta-propeller fold protein YncE
MVKHKRTYLIIKSLFLLVFLLVCLFKPEQVSISAQSESEDYYFVRSFGGGADHVATPFGITVGPQNQIYVINNGRMTVINQNQRTFDVWENFHVSLTLYDNHPAGLAVDSRGNVFFPDRNGDRIVKYSASGEMLTQFGESGTDPGQFKKPYSIAFNNTGQLFVADYGNSRIQVLSPDGDFVR